MPIGLERYINYSSWKGTKEESSVRMNFQPGEISRCECVLCGKPELIRGEDNTYSFVPEEITLTEEDLLSKYDYIVSPVDIKESLKECVTKINVKPKKKVLKKPENK